MVFQQTTGQFLPYGSTAHLAHVAQNPGPYAPPRPSPPLPTFREMWQEHEREQLERARAQRDARMAAYWSAVPSGVEPEAPPGPRHRRQRGGRHRRRA